MYLFLQRTAGIIFVCLFVFLVLALVACDIKTKDSHAEKLKAQASMLKISRITDEQAEWQWEISKPDVNISQLRKNLILIKDPKRDILIDAGESISIAIKKQSAVNSLDLRNSLPGVFKAKSKNNLTPAIYGWYYKVGEQWRLEHVFYQPQAAAKLISHDLGYSPIIEIDSKTAVNADLEVPSNRKYFNFVFDQAILLSNDQAISLKNQDGLEIEIANILVRDGGRKIELSLPIGSDLLKPGQKYVFYFTEIINLDGIKSQIKPINFTVINPEIGLAEVEPIKILSSDNNIEFNWLLNNYHKIEIYWGPDPGPHDCLGQNCPLEKNSLSLKTTTDKLTSAAATNARTNKYLSHVSVDNLKLATAYHFIVRAEDLAGSILVYGRTVKTSPPSPIAWSEIMINPHDSFVSDAEGEYIEFKNISDQAQEFSELNLVIESPEGSKYQECEIINNKSNNRFIWPAQGYVLIAGQGFKPDSYKIPPETNMLKLKQKTLCGGLNNSTRKIIKLISGELILAKFNGYLWQSPAGVSINKLDLTGLDEIKNYCYSEPVHGPTPGQNNRPLGKCGPKF